MTEKANVGLVVRPTWLSILMSVVMIVAGLLAIAMPMAAGIAVNVFVGWMLVIGGVSHLVYAWHRRTEGARAVIWEVVRGVLYVAVGLYLLLNPLVGLLSLTLALGTILAIQAGLELALAFELRARPGWWMLLVDAALGAVLAVLIWATWPSSSAWALGTLVGASLLFGGVFRLMSAIAIRRRLGRRHAGPPPGELPTAVPHPA
ncbi:MAG TPA: HdeD family acid-resistance protein [Kofleriaceae bacterium]|jgi:uncharacterized membrane protein HdeD (DUF308 family)|nr:HdeD family acid-resistance protein [Kofleriaceae bacterium]